MRIQRQRDAFAYRIAYYGSGLRANPNTPSGLPLIGEEPLFLSDEDSQELYDQNVQNDVLGKVDQEFHDWAWENNKENPYDEPGSDGWHGEPRGPVGYWPHIEDFLKEKYPAAHRGLSLGMEEVGYLMDVVPGGHGWGKPVSGQEGLKVDDLDPYETGVDAVAKHGYDPKEIVAALMLLHNGTSPLRRKSQGFQDEDLERLHDIAARRYMMQRQYEEANGGRRSPRDTGPSEPVNIPTHPENPCVWCGEEAEHSKVRGEPLCPSCVAEAKTMKK